MIDKQRVKISRDPLVKNQTCVRVMSLLLGCLCNDLTFSGYYSPGFDNLDDEIAMEKGLASVAHFGED